jgi:shikimate kinase
MLQELAGRGRRVIATGGGVVERPANREVLRRCGWCVWLRGDPATLWERVRDDPTSRVRRPALTGHAGLREVEAMVQAREPLYRETAHFAIETAGTSPGEVVSAILAAWTSS